MFVIVSEEDATSVLIQLVDPLAGGTSVDDTLGIAQRTEPPLEQLRVYADAIRVVEVVRSDGGY